MLLHLIPRITFISVWLKASREQKGKSTSERQGFFQINSHFYSTENNLQIFFIQITLSKFEPFRQNCYFVEIS